MGMNVFHFSSFLFWILSNVTVLFPLQISLIFLLLLLVTGHSIFAGLENGQGLGQQEIKKKKNSVSVCAIFTE